MPSLFDSAVIGFLLSHIPVTVFIDSQIVLPARWYPAPARDLLQWYLDTYRDPLCTARPAWFRTLIWQELLLQLPFFCVGAYAYARGRPWIRKPAILYGISTATTVVPILGEVLAAEGPHSRGVMLAFYLPYLLFPLAIGLRALLQDGGPAPAGPRRRKLQ